MYNCTFVIVKHDIVSCLILSLNLSLLNVCTVVLFLPHGTTYFWIYKLIMQLQIGICCMSDSRAGGN